MCSPCCRIHEEGPVPCLPTPARLRHLQFNPTSAPKCFISLTSAQLRCLCGHNLQGNLVGASIGRSFRCRLTSDAYVASAISYRLISLVHHAGELLPLLPISTMPTAPPAISYQHTPLVYLSGKALSHLRTSTMPTPPPVVSSWVTQFVHPSGGRQHVGGSIGKSPYHGSLYQLAYVTSSYIIPAHQTGASLGRDPAILRPAVYSRRIQMLNLSGRPLPRFPTLVRVLRLRSSHTGAVNWIIFRKAPLPRLPTSSKLLSGGVRPRLPISVTPTPLRSSPTGAPCW